MIKSSDNSVVGKLSSSDPDLAQMYARAFREFGMRALWNMRQLDNPTVEDVLAITRALRIEGDMAARQLAEDIERLACARN